MAQDDDEVTVLEPEVLNGSAVPDSILKRKLSDDIKTIPNNSNQTTKNPSQVAEDKKEEGNKYFKQGSFEKAIQLYTEAIGLYPQPSYFTNRCQCYIKIKKYPEALSDADAAIALDKDFLKGYLRQARCHILTGRLDAARSSLDSAVQAEKKAGLTSTSKEVLSELEVIRSVDKYIRDIETMWLKKDWRAVIYYCGQILEVSPRMTEFTIKKAHAMVFHKQVSEAMNIIVDVLRFDSKNVDALFVRGLALFYTDQMDKAMDHFRMALNLAPDHGNSMSYFKKIKTLKQKKDDAANLLKKLKFRESLEAYSEALKIEPDNSLVNSRLHFNSSICHSKLNNHKLALISCEQALSLDSGYEKASMKKVQILMALEKYEEAMREADAIHKKLRTNMSQVLYDEAKTALKRSKHKDYYKILGVNKNSSEDEIKKAYKKMALVHHPDRHSNSSDDDKKLHEQKFKDCGEAYAVLSDKTKKARYDNGQDIDGMDMSGGGFSHGFDPNDIFAAFFNSTGGGSPFSTGGASFSFGTGGGSRHGNPFGFH